MLGFQFFYLLYEERWWIFWLASEEMGANLIEIIEKYKVLKKSRNISQKIYCLLYFSFITFVYFSL